MLGPLFLRRKLQTTRQRSNGKAQIALLCNEVTHLTEVWGMINLISSGQLYDINNLISSGKPCERNNLILSGQFMGYKGESDYGSRNSIIYVCLYIASQYNCGYIVFE
jgi:hypothetical protein